MVQRFPNQTREARSERNSFAGLPGELYAWLESNIGSNRDSNPIELSECLERELLHLLFYRVALTVDQFARRKRVECFHVDANCFKFGSDYYQLVIAPTPTEPTKLEIILRLISLQRKQYPSTRNIRINSVGRFQTICLRVDQAFRPIDEHIASTAKLIVEAAYNWLQVQNIREICLTAPAIDNEYYNVLRKLFPKTQLSRRIKLNAIVFEHGRYLVDTATCQIAHEAASKPFVATPYSPAKVVSDFFLTYLPFEQKFAKEVFRERRALRADFKRAKYRYASAVNLSEMNVFGASSIIVHPLVDRDKARLVAGYPAELRQEIYPVLEREKHEFERLFDNDVPEISLAESSRQPQVSLITTAADAAGAFTGAAFAHFFNHFPEGK